MIARTLPDIHLRRYRGLSLDMFSHEPVRKASPLDHKERKINLIRGWIAVLMIALSLILGGTEYVYVTSNADAYIRMLDEADEQMTRSEVYAAQETAQKLDNRFRKQSGIFNIFMFHSDIGHISSDLAMLKRYAQTGDAEDFLATSACVKRKITAIRESKMMKLGNIF